MAGATSPAIGLLIFFLKPLSVTVHASTKLTLCWFWQVDWTLHGFRICRESKREQTGRRHNRQVILQWNQVDNCCQTNPTRFFAVETIPDNEHGVEINLQTVQLTLKTAHLKALDRKIAERPDCQDVRIFSSSFFSLCYYGRAHHDFIRV